MLVQRNELVVYCPFLRVIHMFDITLRLHAMQLCFKLKHTLHELPQRQGCLISGAGIPVRLSDRIP